MYIKINVTVFREAKMHEMTFFVVAVTFRGPVGAGGLCCGRGFQPGQCDSRYTSWDGDVSEEYACRYPAACERPRLCVSARRKRPSHSCAQESQSVGKEEGPYNPHLTPLQPQPPPADLTTPTSRGHEGFGSTFRDAEINTSGCSVPLSSSLLRFNNELSD